MKNNFDDLIIKFLHHELDEKETLILKEWLKDEGNKAVLEEKIRLHHLCNASLETFDAESAYQKQFSQLHIEKVEAPIVRKLWLRYVAAAVLLAVLGIGVYLGKNLINGNEGAIVAGIIEPGTDKAMLTLSNGEKIELKGASGVITLGGGGTASNDTTGLLNYANGTDVTLSFNTLEVPRGGTYQVILTDGTKVWLNADSKLRYAVGHQVGERTVDLEGEAYFEVKKDANRPFKVKCKGQEIEVLGTHFNVNSYVDEPFLKTTLLEGAIKVTSDKGVTLLKPGQESINKNGVLAVRKVADAEEAISWKNGYFQFEDENIESVTRKISRWYDVDVKFIGQTANKKFNGIISRSKSLNNALKVMEATENVKFKIEGRTLIVKI